MSDRYLIPVNGQWLALDADAFAAALEAGAQAVPAKASAPAVSEPTRLHSAQEIAKQFGVDESWVLQRARLNEIPCVKLGKYRRFDAALVMAALARSGDTRIADPRTPPKPMKSNGLSPPVSKPVADPRRPNGGHRGG